MPAPLPIEMFAEIARHAGESRDRKSIQQCTLISRAFRGVFEPWMYKTLAFGNAEPPAGSVADPTWGDWNVENTSHLLDTTSARPSLGRHTTTVVVGVATSFDDEHFPKLLTLLPLVKFFTLFALGQNWSCLGTEMQRAAIRMCQSSNLVKLHISGFWALPSTLLCTNLGLRHLAIGNILAFSRGEPHDNYWTDVAAEPVDVPSTHFRSLRLLQCTYHAVLEKNQWLSTAIRSSSVSGSLRALVVTIIANPGSYSFGNPLVFGCPINLSHVQNLALLGLRVWATDFPCPNDGMAEFFFRSFCDFVNGTLLTLTKGACLGALGLQFKVDYSPDIFLEADIWDTPAWRHLCDTMSDKKAQLSDVRLHFKFKGSLAKELHPSAQSRLDEHVLRTGPKLRGKVVYEFSL